MTTTGENLIFKQIAEILKNHFGDKANKVSTKEIADFVVKVLSLFIRKMKMPASFLGQNTACSNEKAKKMLGWQPRSAENAVVATAESMLRLGLIKK